MINDLTENKKYCLPPASHAPSKFVHVALVFELFGFACFANEPTKTKTPQSGDHVLVTHVDQTWNQVVTGLERIDSAVEESLKSEEQ